MQRKPTTKTTFLILAGGVALVVILVYLNRAPKQWISDGIRATFEDSEKRGIETEKQAEQLHDQQPQTWPTYKDTALGITFKYPPETSGSKMVFIQAGNVLFVRTASSSLYVRRSELPAEGDWAILDKARDIEKDAYNGGFGWAIWVQDAYSDDDLQRIINKWFGERHGFGDGCKLAGKKNSSQTGVYNVRVDPVKAPDEYDVSKNGSCFRNWMWSFKYSPEHHRAAIWDIGQENRFWDSLQDHDPYIRDSFTFIPREE